MRFDPRGDLYEQRPPLAPGERRFLFLFCVAFFGLLLFGVLQDFEPARLGFVFFPLFWGALVAIHEGAHAVAARACGWQVEQVVVGFGRTLLRFEVGGTPVEIRALPLIGYTQPRPTRASRQRLANALIYFAGPGIELVLVAALVAVVGYDAMTSRTDHLGVVAAQSFSIAALMGALINLVPHVGPGGAWSDGMGVVMSPFLTEGHFEQRMAAPLQARAEELVAAGDPAGALELLEEAAETYPRALGLQFAAARLLVALGKRGDALFRLQALSRDARLEPVERRAVEEVLKQVRAA